jgi:hypothetical protein
MTKTETLLICWERKRNPANTVCWETETLLTNNMLGNGNPAHMLGDGNPVNMLGVTGSRELGILSVIFNLFLGEQRCLERPSKFLHLQIYVCNIKRTSLCDE